MKALVPAALMAAFFVTTAQAQQTCGSHADLKAEAAKNGASVVTSGLSAKGHVLEVWMLPNGNWMAVVVLPDGVTACLVDFGVGLDVDPAFNPAANNSL